jgi:hypothetical protein
MWGAAASHAQNPRQEPDALHTFGASTFRQLLRLVLPASASTKARSWASTDEPRSLRLRERALAQAQRALVACIAPAAS